MDKKSTNNEKKSTFGRPKVVRPVILGRPGGMSGAAGVSFRGVEILVKLVKLELGKKFWKFGTGQFDKNYKTYLARTAPRLEPGAADLIA